MPVREDEWLHGWDTTPGIVSVWAEPDGRAFVWRRVPETGELVRDDVRYRPWVLLAALEDLAHLGGRLRSERDGAGAGAITYEELEGPGALRYLVRADDGRGLAHAILHGASRRLGHALRDLKELGKDSVLVLSPEDQYLTISGRSYFRGLGFDALRRAQLDLETTGLDPSRDRIFLVALRSPDGSTETLEAEGESDRSERDLIERLAARVRAIDPDVIENHNLHGFDLPFLVRRARSVGASLALARWGPPGFAQRPAARGARLGGAPDTFMRRARYTLPGRELIDTMDAVRRHDFSARDLPGHGLKAVARHFGIAAGGPSRELIPGARVFAVWKSDPDRVRRYAGADVTEAASLAALLGGATFALSGMAPRRYERLADAGAATGVIDPMLVRAYLREKKALPACEESDGTQHTGAALHLFATGVAHRIVKADVASLYPSLMRAHRIGPARDHLGVMLTLVDRLVIQRLEAKARARTLVAGSEERFALEALSAAMKLVVNSAYGYLAASSLTRFSDVHAANDVTRHGREVLGLICRELQSRGVTLLEADTDGVYFSVPQRFTEEDERRLVREVRALLPPLVSLEHDGRYRAMLSHEPKNYALEGYDGRLHLRGVAFRSSRAEPFGEAFLRVALARLLQGDVAGVRDAYVAAAFAIARRQVPTGDVSARVRLTKSPAEYLATRASRRELPYEAMLTSGRTAWEAGERVRVYRAVGKRAALFVEEDGGAEPALDPRDYDTEIYGRLLRETFAARLVRALSPEDYRIVFDDPRQPSLFPASLAESRPILTVLADPITLAEAEPAED